MTDSFRYFLGKLLNSGIKDLRQISYTLATVRHETGNTFKPIVERGSEKYLKGKSYYPFIGRGYAMITWEANYKKFGDLLGIDLVKNMDLACDPEISFKILELGMLKGLFTGKKLSDYFNDDTCDWYKARKIINGLDKAELIASYARQYYKLLEELTNV